MKDDIIKIGPNIIPWKMTDEEEYKYLKSLNEKGTMPFLMDADEWLKKRKEQL